MARTVAELPKGARITDHISLGVLTKTFPLDNVTAAVAAAGKTSQRQRDLPAHVVVYYVMALTLYLQGGVLSVAAKKGTKMATKWSPAGRAVRSEPFPLLRSVLRNGPGAAGAGGCWARRSDPLTARTVLR